MSIITDIDKKDSVFANAADAVSDFETIFDEEDALIEMVCGFGENGESLIGRDPEEENTTDNDDGKVDMEDSSPSTDFDLEPDAETGEGIEESVDLDDYLLEECDDVLPPSKLSNNAEEQTDETDKKNILDDVDDAEVKDFHNESADLDALFGLLEGNDVCPNCGCNPCSCAPLEPSKLSNNAEEQTDETDKKDILDDVDDAEVKDFHNESADLDDMLYEAEEQTDETDPKNPLEEPDEVEEKDFHNESTDLDDFLLDECDVLPPSKLSNNAEEQTDETDKKNVLDDVDDAEVKDFHNEGAELDALFESLEGEDDFDEYDDSFEGMDDDDDIDESADIDTILYEAKFSFLPRFKEKADYKELTAAIKQSENLLASEGTSVDASGNKFGSVALRILDILYNIGAALSVPSLLLIITIPYYLINRLIEWAIQAGKESVAENYANKCIRKLEKIKNETSDKKVKEKCDTQIKKITKAIANLNESADIDNLLYEADEEDVDFAEDELMDQVEDNAGPEMNLDYEPGEDDQIIDDVIDGKEI